ncbi:hypothetical protein FXO38_28169 [Capsicum annuum]|nr:hypothetical protein FXO37_35245 [Capsicum annuum]KAF3628561.1 hypothetical protein FXO38_28169 [Capsicum annuum]
MDSASSVRFVPPNMICLDSRLRVYNVLQVNTITETMKVCLSISEDSFTTPALAFFHIQMPEIHQGLSKDKVKQCVDARLNTDYPPKTIAKIGAVAALCVPYEADFRPNMSIVAKALQPLLPRHVNIKHMHVLLTPAFT